MKKSGIVLAVALALGAPALSQANDAYGVSSQAQLFMQLQQLQQEVATLRGLLEEQQHQISRLTEENRDRYQALDSRISHAAGSVESVAPPAVTGSSPSSASQPASPVAPGDPAKEQEFYDAAYSLIQAKDLGRARQAFSGFLARYPQGSYAANAHYWLGEIALVQDDLQHAGESFARVIADWPRHNKVSDSIYKLGVVEQRLGRGDRASQFFRQVISEFPDSSAARLAQKEL